MSFTVIVGDSAGPEMTVHALVKRMQHITLKSFVGNRELHSSFARNQGKQFEKLRQRVIRTSNLRAAIDESDATLVFRSGARGRNDIVDSVIGYCATKKWGRQFGYRTNGLIYRTCMVTMVSSNIAETRELQDEGRRTVTADVERVFALIKARKITKLCIVGVNSEHHVAEEASWRINVNQFIVELFRKIDADIDATLAPKKASTPKSECTLSWDEPKVVHVGLKKSRRRLSAFKFVDLVKQARVDPITGETRLGAD